MTRLLLTLQYDGTRYHGWQVQRNARTVQEVLQDAVERITGVRAGVTGCSRTDAGVHADMFCCTFDTGSTMTEKRMIAALNACLPEDIAVYDCRAVPADFHPRYSAVGKRYVYRIWNAPARNPFWNGRALHYRYPLDETALDRAAAGFLGTHDFSALCAAGSTVEDTVRTMTRCGVERRGELLLLTAQADGFLYNMVRILAGTLLDMASGHIPYDAAPLILEGKNRAAAGKTAPAHGLYLDRVFYENLEDTDRLAHAGAWSPE